MRLRTLVTSRSVFAALALSALAACEVNVVESRGANAPPANGGGTAPPAYGNGGTTAPPAYGNGGTTAPPAYGNGGTTAPPAYGNGGATAPPARGNGGTTAPPAYGNGGTTAPPANTGGPVVAPPPSNVGGGLVASGTGLPFGPGAMGRMRPIQILPTPAPSGPGTRGSDMATPIGRLPLVAGDVDFGTNVQYADSIKGLVYLLPPGTTSMPNYDAMRPQLALWTRTFEVEPQNYAGLNAPGASPRATDFGIRYEGFVTARQGGTYQITMANEDGAKLYIDNRLVIDNDGVHPVTYKTVNVDLTAAVHLLRIDYFKAGTNREVCLEVWVHTPSMQPEAVWMLSPSL
jgi:hypothetical protein